MGDNDRQDELEWAFNMATMCVCLSIDDQETKNRIVEELDRLLDETKQAIDKTE